jgi:hypothetical protein
VPVTARYVWQQQPIILADYVSNLRAAMSLLGSGSAHMSGRFAKVSALHA